MTSIPDPSVVNFLMVGCPRCGTTWVHAALKDHPNVFLPAQKQTYFYDVNYDKGLDWYLGNFSTVSPQHVAVGEIATGYSQPHAIPRMARDFPHVRIMLAMRDPSDRAYSFYQSRAVNQGWRTIQEAIEEQPEILEQGKYIEQIEQLLEHYDRDRMLLLFYEDLRDDDRAYLASILRFLGVDSEYESPQFGRMVQVAAFPKLRRLLYRMKMQPLVDWVSRHAIGDYIRRQIKNRNVRRYSTMDAKTRKFLTDFYRPYNERLQAYTGRDLSHWMN